jgi:hypothetical protein
MYFGNREDIVNDLCMTNKGSSASDHSRRVNVRDYGLRLSKILLGGLQIIQMVLVDVDTGHRSEGSTNHVLSTRKE